MDEPTMTPATSAVYWQMRAKISALEMRVGERLGTERELAAELGVGRNLLRQALQVMEGEGRVRRSIGRRGGVFVSDGKIDRYLNTIVGVPTNLRRQGFVSSTQVLKAAVTTAGEEDARALSLRTGDPIFELVRLRLADDIPLSVETAKLPASIFPGLLDHPLDHSLYELLAKSYGARLGRAEETIEARLAMPVECEPLGVDSTSVVFHVRRVTWDSQQRPIEFAHDIFRADRMRIQVLADGGSIIPRSRVADRGRRATR